MSTVVSKYRESLEVQIQYFAKQQNILNPEFQSSIRSKKGDNYLGIAHQVEVQGEVNGRVHKFHLLFKRAPEDEKLRKEFKIRSFYLHEIEFYEEIWPIFTKFLNERNYSINHIPRFYGCSKVPRDEVLILEDLSSRGFKMRNPVMLDYSHATIALRHLARFHAYSFAIRDQNPGLFERIKSVEEPFFTDPVTFKENFGILCDVAKKAVESEGELYTERISELNKKITQLLSNAVDGKNAEPYAVLNHGDFWTNNMLFKYNNDGEPEDFYMVDYQAFRYASPALDISYMLFNCCIPELRREYIDEFLQQYHNSLSGCLRDLGSDVERLFPFEKLLEQFNRFAYFGVILSLAALYLFTRQEGESPKLFTDLQYLRTVSGLLESNSLYASMMKGTFKDAVDRNYI